MSPITSESAKYRETCFVGLAAGILAWLAVMTLPALRLAENWVTDLGRIAVAPVPGPATDIVLVTITEETLATLPYRSPVNRLLLVEVVEKVVAAGGKGLALDVLLDQPTEKEADRNLREALHATAKKIPLVVASAGQAERLTQRQEEFLLAFTDGLAGGLVNLPTDDDDGIVRWQQFGRSTPDGRLSPGFAAALAERLSPGSAGGKEGIAPLAYSRKKPGEPADFTTFPAHTLKFIPNDWLAGKIVLVGADMPHTDRHRTPFSALGAQAGIMPGIAIHAHGLNHILAGIRLTESPPWVGIPIAIVVSVLTAFTFGLGHALAVRILIWGGVAFGYVVIATWVLAGWGLFLPIMAPFLGVALAAATKGGREWLRERRQRAFIQDAFSRYLSPGFVKILVQNPDRLHLGGEMREITYVFTDLAGFTGATEKIQPEIFVEILNEYLDNMCRIALDHQATIDKIVGDAVVAFFGAPIDQPDHAGRGVRLALAYDRFSEEFRVRMRARGLDLGVTRVGVNTGMATVGNFGGNRFFNYTGHGDAVNTAARLESLNKHLGTRICVGSATASRCPGVAFRPAGNFILKGKKQQIETFEPLAGEVTNYAPLADYQAAFDLMRIGTPETQQAFAILASRYPQDPLVDFHNRRGQEGELGTTIVMAEK